MKKPMFTAEELAELAAYDALIDEQPITMDELRASRERDNDARLDRLDHRSRAIAERAREYYAANKEAIAERVREYYYADRAKKDDIRLRRKELGMSQAELASRVGTSQPMISMIECGRANARPEVMRDLYQVLGMEVTA